MLEYFRNLSTFENSYLYIAVISSILFVVQSLFTFLDLGSHFEMDQNFDGHVDFDLAHAFGLPFNLFTIRGIIGFFILFGWTGLIVSKSGTNPLLTLLIALACGFAMMIMIGFIYYMVNKLGESGNVNIKSSIGKEGEVYIPVPGENTGTGKVSIIINDSLKELDAITLGGTINYGEIVKVVNVLNDKLVVEKINKEKEK